MVDRSVMLKNALLVVYHSCTTKNVARQTSFRIVNRSDMLKNAFWTVNHSYTTKHTLKTSFAWLTVMIC